MQQKNLAAFKVFSFPAANGKAYPVRTLAVDGQAYFVAQDVSTISGDLRAGTICRRVGARDHFLRIVVGNGDEVLVLDPQGVRAAVEFRMGVVHRAAKRRPFSECLGCATCVKGYDVEMQRFMAWVSRTAASCKAQAAKAARGVAARRSTGAPYGSFPTNTPVLALPVNRVTRQAWEEILDEEFRRSVINAFQTVVLGMAAKRVSRKALDAARKHAHDTAVRKLVELLDVV